MSNQSEDGRGLGCCAVIGLPQHSTSPSPALVINTSVLQISHRNLLPKRFGIFPATPFSLLSSSSHVDQLERVFLSFFLHGLPATSNRAIARTGYDQFRPALGTPVSLPHLVSHNCATFQIPLSPLLSHVCQGNTIPGSVSF